MSLHKNISKKEDVGTEQHPFSTLLLDSSNYYSAVPLLYT